MERETWLSDCILAATHLCCHLWGPTYGIYQKKPAPKWATQAFESGTGTVKYDDFRCDTARSWEETHTLSRYADVNTGPRVWLTSVYGGCLKRGAILGVFLRQRLTLQPRNRSYSPFFVWRFPKSKFSTILGIILVLKPIVLETFPLGCDNLADRGHLYAMGKPAVGYDLRFIGNMNVLYRIVHI